MTFSLLYGLLLVTVTKHDRSCNGNKLSRACVNNSELKFRWVHCGSLTQFTFCDPAFWIDFKCGLINIYTHKVTTLFASTINIRNRWHLWSKTSTTNFTPWTVSHFPNLLFAPAFLRISSTSVSCWSISSTSSSSSREFLMNGCLHPPPRIGDVENVSEWQLWLESCRLCWGAFWAKYAPA